jgi:hypothetical protein
MPRKSAAGKLVHHGPDYVPKTSKAELARVVALMDEPIDTSDIPEHKGPLRPIKRDAEGRLPEPLPELRDSPIRLAILAQLGLLHMNRYQLWKKARLRCARLPRSAVYEYLRGQRPIGVTYIEALIEAADLAVGPVAKKKTRPRTQAATEAQ